MTRLILPRVIQHCVIPLAFIVCVVLISGCVESPPAETTNAEELPTTETIIPEDGSEPVLAEEGP